MPTPKKAETIDELTGKLRRARAAIIIKAEGLTVAESTTLRRQLRAAGVELHVAKNTLIRIAARQAGYTGLDELWQGPTAVAFVYENEPTAAKLISDYVRLSRIVTLKPSMLGGKVISTGDVGTLATAPPRPVLLAQTLGAIQGPASGAVGVVAGPLTNFMYLLQARIDQMGGEAA